MVRVVPTNMDTATVSLGARFYAGLWTCKSVLCVLLLLTKSAFLTFFVYIRTVLLVEILINNCRNNAAKRNRLRDNRLWCL